MKTTPKETLPLFAFRAPADLATKVQAHADRDTGGNFSRALRELVEAGLTVAAAKRKAARTRKRNAREA